MKVIVFDQWEKLVAKVRAIASSAADESSQYGIVRQVPTGGKVRLVDRAMNVLAVEGGETEIAMPDIDPGRARDFMLRVSATGENALKFTGAEAFEGDSGALAPPGDGETVVYFFTETAADRLLVGRRHATKIET